MNPETLNTDFERVQRRAYRLARRLLRTASGNFREGDVRTVARALRDGDIQTISEALMTGWQDLGYAPSPNRRSLVSLVWCAGTVAAHGLARQARLKGPAAWSEQLQRQYLELCREYLCDVVCEFWSRRTGASPFSGDCISHVVVSRPPSPF